ncbi:hypothetical protein [Methanofollis fontis]|uniref:hypothetical protein n=1 Tax=Methanofollis fontis TaxID=2052832 RepID=UPI0013EE8295|nr:hypothetical protein [Methanofollis fontis]
MNGAPSPEARRKNRFVLEEGDIRITGRHPPDEEEKGAAEAFFLRVLRQEGDTEGK